MTLKSLKTYFINSLVDYYPETEVNSFFYILTLHILNKRRIDVSLNYDIEVFNNDKIKFQDSIERLKKHEPIQYIIGKTEFYGLPFKLSNNVLIPRPETEELVDWVISKFKSQKSKIRVLDIGTGSGCIAISLAKNLPDCKIVALDISSEALKIAKENAKLNNVEVKFIAADILNWNLELDNLKFEVIVSNPPYVRALEKNQMKKNVLVFEPHLALFVEDEDSLLFYRKIIQLTNKILKSKGQLFFEINEYLGKETVKLLRDNGFEEIELKSDIFGKDRIIKGVKS